MSELKNQFNLIENMVGSKNTHASSSSCGWMPARATSANGSGASKIPLFSEGARSLGRVVSNPKKDIFGRWLMGVEKEGGGGN